MIWINAGILIVNILVFAVTYCTAYRHRVIYDLKTHVFRMPTGGLQDTGALDTTDIDQDLRGGEYTVLSAVPRVVDGDVQILLGRIKK